MKVLQVIPGLAMRTGGVAAAAVEASRALRKLGIESTIFATDLPASASAGTVGRVRRQELPPGSDELDIHLFPTRPPRRLAYAPALGRALARSASAYDVLHIHSLFLYPQWAAYRAARRASVPYVISPHGTLDPYLRRRGPGRKALTNALWQRAMLERASVLHFGADDEAALAADVAPDVPRSVIPNPIDLAAYAELPPGSGFREERLGGHQGPLVLFLGRIAEKKGVDVLIRAFAHVVGELPDARLAIVGPDDEGLAAGLRKLAADEGLDGRVLFTGMLHGEEKLSALAAADVWALSSHSDACAVAVAEALAAGLPIVVSPAVNLAPDIGAAGAGIVAPLDPTAFGGELVALLRDPARSDALRSSARVFARRYGHEAVGHELAALYEEAACR